MGASKSKKGGRLLLLEVVVSKGPPPLLVTGGGALAGGGGAAVMGAPALEELGSGGATLGRVAMIWASVEAAVVLGTPPEAAMAL